MAYLNSSEVVSTVLDVLRIKLCIRSFRLQVAAVLGTANSLSASVFSVLTLSFDQWLSTYLACRDTAESRHLYWPRGRERGRSGDCSVVERYSRACVAVQGRTVWKRFFFPPHLLFNDSTAAAVVMLCLFLSSLLTIRCLAETISLWSAYLRRAVDSDKVLNCCHFSTLGWLDGLRC